MDQTNFSENQEVLQPPPGEVYVHKDNLPEKKPKPKKPILLIIAGTLVGLAALLGIALLFTGGVGPLGGIGEPVPTPDFSTPAPTVRPLSEFGQRLQGVKSHINSADPRTMEITPPQIELELSL